MKRQIWLSFDYELFLGAKSGTPEACLLRPTQLLIDQMQILGIRATFYVDASYLVRLSQESDALCQSHYEMIATQLRDLVRLGHRVELHLHPHWIDAIYMGQGTWSFPSYQNYCIDALTEVLAMEQFVRGAEQLLSILGGNYRLKAFRAGGLCVLPFDKIRGGMDAVDLKIDSSVAPGLVGHFSYGNYDFSNMQWVHGPYQFQESPLAKVESGKYTEIPILCFRHNIVQKILSSLDRKRVPGLSAFGDGKGIYESRQKSMLSRILPSSNPLTVDQAHSLTWDRNWGASSGDGSMLCHPKSLNPTSFEILEKMAKSGDVEFRLSHD